MTRPDVIEVVSNWREVRHHTASFAIFPTQTIQLNIGTLPIRIVETQPRTTIDFSLHHIGHLTWHTYAVCSIPNVSAVHAFIILKCSYFQIFFTATFAYLLIDTSTLDSISNAPHYIQVFGSMLMCLPFAYYLLIQTITHFKLGKVRQLSIIIIKNASSSAHLIPFLFSQLER
mgnify:CR=1 FL=1